MAETEKHGRAALAEVERADAELAVGNACPVQFAHEARDRRQKRHDLAALEGLALAHQAGETAAAHAFQHQRGRPIPRGRQIEKSNEVRGFDSTESLELGVHATRVDPDGEDLEGDRAGRSGTEIHVGPGSGSQLSHKAVSRKRSVGERHLGHPSMLARRFAPPISSAHAVENAACIRAVQEVSRLGAWSTLSSRG